MRTRENSGGDPPEPPEPADAPTQIGGRVVLRAPAPEVELARGDVLAGRYQIEKLIGRGATGSVLRAFDRVVRNVVAVKILKPDMAADPRWVERLGGELRYARRLQHPNVCRVFEMSKADGVHFLTMEFAAGGSLRQRLAGAPERSLDERLNDARAVIEGVAAIHHENVVHRDLKPENVLVMEDGRLVISDLGLAVTLGQATFFSSQVAGTPSYMAPEVVMGEKPTLATDVWALGVILHEILFGKRPEWVTTNKSRALVAPVDDKAPRLLRGLAALCADCLQELPPRRPRDASEVRRRFEDVATGRWRPVRRVMRRWWVVAAGVLAVGAAGAIGVMRWWRGAGARSTAPTPPTLVITGEARDVSSARVLWRGDRAIRCIEPIPGTDRAVIAIATPRAAEPEAFEIDTRTGVRTKTRLVPDTYRSGCPRFSPDGSSVLFTAKRPDSSPKIMLSTRADGSEPHELGQGTDPRWMPSGREFVFAFDPRHPAAMSVTGGLLLFPEAPADHKSLMGAVPSRDGKRVTILFAGQDRAFIEDYEFPSLTRLSVTQGASISGIPPSSENEPFVTVADPNEWILARRAPGVLVRLATARPANIELVWKAPGGLVFSTYENAMSLFLKMPGQPETEVFSHQPALNPTVSSFGDVVVEMRLPDGRRVLARASDGELRPISDGPADGHPAFVPAQRTFVFVDSTRATLNACTLDDAHDRPSCRSLYVDYGNPGPPAPSPEGRRVAYILRTGDFAHLRLVSMGGGLERDLGSMATDCPIYWSSEDTVWAHRSSEWVELNISGPVPIATGRRVDGKASPGCQSPVPAPTAEPILRGQWAPRATLRITANFD